VVISKKTAAKMPKRILFTSLTPFKASISARELPAKQLFSTFSAALSFFSVGSDVSPHSETAYSGKKSRFLPNYSRKSRRKRTKLPTKIGSFIILFRFPIYTFHFRCSGIG
jgi:hypothetical protein